MSTLRPIEWIRCREDRLTPGKVRLLDQTLLPATVTYVDTQDLAAVWTAIKTLQVRGAPAIGIAAAMGVALAAQQQAGAGRAAAEAERAADYLATARPTAVNLFWALDRMRRTCRRNADLPSPELAERLAREAVAIRDEDAAMCRAIGRHGAALLAGDTTVLTHCNAGALATSELGTALAPIYTAHAEGKRVRVFADETRPLLQGSRLTAWELMQAGIDVTVICDSAAGHVMQQGKIDVVFVGADRIAANGDTANKIGTYGVARLAADHGIPFYVLAPTSTVDPDTATGADIPIEERSGEEIVGGFGRPTGPPGVSTYAPAFDVTPAELITGIVCEKGVVAAPFASGLAAVI